MSKGAKRQASVPHVLILDDDVELLELLTMRLEAQGYRVTVETTARGGLRHVGAQSIDAMILDLRLGDADGLNVLTEVQKRSADVPVIILTAHGTIQTAVEAMHRGAYGFLTKPFQDIDLMQKLTHAIERQALRREVAGLRRIVGGISEDQRLVGTSAALARVREVVARIAPTDATVLITGESGTGKELAARSLHALSPRSRGPFIAVNCGALPPDLLESTLFGHARGSFTGATSDREGLFGAARAGTLFLDEVGEASPAVQVKLLRALQERRYTRVGSYVEEEADVRVVAATNRDLRAEVTAKRFREDLFYRLHVVPLYMPPLRERTEDIPPLAEMFLERAAARYGMAVPTLTGDALEALLQWHWPGNIRELANVLEAAVLLTGEGTLRAEHLGHVARAAEGSGSAARARAGEVSETLTTIPALAAALLREIRAELPQLKEARDAFERAYLVEVLQRCDGNISAAARLAGRNRTDFYDLLRRHGLSPAAAKDLSD